jgi:uncharacterized RDD family membrane protein YckC
VTPPAHRPYAGIVSRSIAFCVDAVVVVVATTAGVVGVEVVGVVLGRKPQHLGAALAIAPVVLLFVYSVAFWVLAGRTLGTALLGLRVIRIDGRLVSWGQAVIRALIMLIFPIGFLWSLLDRRHQAIHDKLARTVVVRDLSEHPGDERVGSGGQRRAT